MSYSSDDCYSPAPEESSQEFVLLVVTSTDKEQIAQFETKYPTHTSRCALAKLVDLDPAHSLPFNAEVRRFAGSKITDEFDMWLAEAMNNSHRKIFNVSDWGHLVYLSETTGQVHPYLSDATETTAPNSPCEPKSCPRSSGSGSSAASSVTSTPEKKKKSRKFYSDEDPDEQSFSPWDTLSIPSSTTSAVSQLRKKVSKLDLSC